MAVIPGVFPFVFASGLSNKKVFQRFILHSPRVGSPPCGMRVKLVSLVGSDGTRFGYLADIWSGYG